MRRLLFKLHRWLGMGIGLIMLLWCLSGFVMMYVPYPALSSAEALRAKPLLVLADCCNSAAIETLGLVDVHGFRVSMLAGRPVVEVHGSGGQRPLLDLRSGAVITAIGASQARSAAEEFTRARGIAAPLAEAALIPTDQWTVSAYFDPHRPLYKFTATDEARSEWYVSSRNGEVLQFTTAGQRFWNWLGAVPHWLYPTVLRQHDAVWAQVVIVLSALGSFLTLLGLYAGVVQWRRLPSGRHSPHRGWGLWHHYGGLLAGIFLLSWVASGLFSMRPWGWFDSQGAGEVARRLEGVPLFSSEVADVLRRLPGAQLPADTVAVEGYASLGTLYLLAQQRDGGVQRLDGRFQPAVLQDSDWQRLARRAAGASAIAQSALLLEDDAYYYAGHELTGELPVYRVLLNDDGRSRIYLDADSGRLAAYIDSAEKRYRWMFAALHRVDVGWLRRRPLWDVLVAVLLAGVTLSALTGTVLAWRRLRRNARR